MISASSAASRGSGFTSSSVRNSCSLACDVAATCDRRRCRRRSRPARSPCPARATPRAGCTCARLRCVRSARPRCGSSDGSEYCAFMFSQPPPFRISFTSISSRSHCSKWMIGVPGPRLLPEFSPVSESTEFGRSLPRLRRLGDRLADLLLHPDLVGADRRLAPRRSACRCPGRSRPRRRRPDRCSGR